MLSRLMLRTQSNVQSSSMIQNSIFVRDFSDGSSKKPKRTLQDVVHPNTPLGMLDRQPKKDDKNSSHVEVEDDEKPSPFDPFPDSTNPVSGEVGGPTGPEPTRYGDWEKKGRVTDF